MCGKVLADSIKATSTKEARLGIIVATIQVQLNIFSVF